MELGTSLLFISHDLAVVQHISHIIGVMYLGQLVEVTDCDTLFQNPGHPYTQALMSAVPIPDPRLRKKRIILKGDVPSPLDLPSGCPFHSRCNDAMPICKKMTPKSVNLRDKYHPHWVSCHIHDPENH